MKSKMRFSSLFKRAERWAAPEPARIPSGAEAGLEQASGLLMPAEEMRRVPHRGLQGRPTYSLDEGRA